MTYRDSKEARTTKSKIEKQKEYDCIQKQCSDDAMRRFKEKPYALKYIERMKENEQNRRNTNG